MGGRRVELPLADRGPRPLERAVHRCHGGVEQLGDLVGVPVQDLARIRTARWRAGRFCNAATNARRTDSRAIATSAGAAARRRRDPARARSRWPPGAARGCHPGVPAGFRSTGRARRWLAPRFQADVRRDAVEPRAEARTSLERLGRARRGETSPGRRLRPRTGARHPVAIGGEARPETARAQREGRRRREGPADARRWARWQDRSSEHCDGRAADRRLWVGIVRVMPIVERTHEDGRRSSCRAVARGGIEWRRQLHRACRPTGSRLTTG